MNRKDAIEKTLFQAEAISLDAAEVNRAWLRLCRELRFLSAPEARSPRFNGLLKAIWIAASNDQT